MTDINNFQILLRFISTLTATLIGVLLGLKKDRTIQKEKTERTALHHLKSIKNEIELNYSVARGNYNLIDALQQQQEFDADHYLTKPYSTNAWEAALSDQIIETIDSDLYLELQDLYSMIQSTNEQIRRLRTEHLHDSVGGKIDYGVTEAPIWTIDVNYWDDQNGQIGEKAIGELIRDHSNEIRILIDGCTDQVDQDIERIEESLGEGQNQAAKGFNQRAARNYQR